MTEYDVNIDKNTFNALICDCYRHTHPPLKNVRDQHGKWIQVPYHYGEKWDKNNDMTWLEEMEDQVSKL